MLHGNRLSRRRVAALAATVALGVLGLRPEPRAAAAFQSLTITSSTCQHVTAETNAVPTGPSDWQPVWSCATTASTNANIAGGLGEPTPGTLNVYVTDYANPAPCSPTADVDMLVVYADAFGVVSFEAPAMPYEATTNGLPQCQTDYPLNGRITSFSTNLGAYSGMDEVCSFHAWGLDGTGNRGGNLVGLGLDNQHTTSPCTITS